MPWLARAIRATWPKYVPAFMYKHFADRGMGDGWKSYMNVPLQLMSDGRLLRRRKRNRPLHCSNWILDKGEDGRKEERGKRERRLLPHSLTHSLTHCSISALATAKQQWCLRRLHLAP